MFSFLLIVLYIFKCKLFKEKGKETFPQNINFPHDTTV